MVDYKRRVVLVEEKERCGLEKCISINNKMYTMDYIHDYMVKLKAFILRNNNKDGICKIGNINFISIIGGNKLIVYCIHENRLYNIDENHIIILDRLLKMKEELFE